ncbi:MAG: hypothetical protein JXR69_02905 [Candidatus Delongbacteria bacterium]|nr:hypothetical protein [Candidatus Delongbacteria bacterium]
MKIKILILTVFSVLLFLSCTPEVDDDLLTIYSQNNSVYSKFDSDTIVALVRTRYSSFPYRNGVALGDTSYSANTLFMKTFDSSNWLFLGKLDNDSNLNVVKWDNINKKIHIRYDDTLVFVKDLRHIGMDDTIAFNDSVYPNIETFTLTLSADSTYIDSINNGNWYKTYRSWKDDMINLYR